MNSSGAAVVENGADQSSPDTSIGMYNRGKREPHPLYNTKVGKVVAISIIYAFGFTTTIGIVRVLRAQATLGQESKGTRRTSQLEESVDRFADSAFWRRITSWGDSCRSECFC
jgi:hypothetical protein